METERRQQPRKQPEKLTYVHFEPENGGIVLNASEGGISFFAIAPFQQTGPIRFTIVPSTQEGIIAAGQIVWTDELKKVGGLSFAELAPEVRERVRGWLSQRAAPAIPEANKEPLKPDELAEMDRQEQRARDAMGLHATFAQHIPPPDSTISPTRASSVYAYPTSLFPPESATRDPQMPLSRPQFMRGAATGILISIFALMTFVFLQNFSPGIAGSLIRFGERLVQINQPVPPSPAPPPELPASAVQDDRPVASEPSKEISSSEALEDSPLPSAVAPRPANSPPANPQAAELPNPPQPPRHASGVRNSATTSQRLWKAVAQGNTTAEIALAQLYLTGNGVPRSCEQARVLLSAASKKGNAEATRQYRSLLSTACN
jgi:PilZ domain